MSDTVYFPSYTTANGMTINRGYMAPCLEGEKAIRFRECLFPEGHYMNRTYGLESMKISKSGSYYNCDLKGTVLKRELSPLQIDSPSALKDVLKSLKWAKSLPKEALQEGSGMAEMITNLLRIGKHVRI